MLNENLKSKTAIIIPAYNEEDIIAQTIALIPPGFSIFTVDNGSQDKTAQYALEAGSKVIFESRKGYGRAVHTGLLEAHRLGYTVAVVLDADCSNDPKDIEPLVLPIFQEEMDLVLGQRNKFAEPQSLTPLQKYGNILAAQLISILTDTSFSDLGSFRALRLSCLKDLRMEDDGFGWNIEMQMKAALLNLNIKELELRYTPRSGGTSKISGDPKAALRAGAVIIYTAFKNRKL